MEIGDIYNPYKKYYALYVPDWVASRVELSPLSKLVFGILVKYGGARGEMFPSVKTVATALGCDEKRVRRSIKQLKETGLLAVTDRRKFGKTNIYHFMANRWAVDAEEKALEEGADSGLDTDADPIGASVQPIGAGVLTPNEIIKKSSYSIRAESLRSSAHPWTQKNSRDGDNVVDIFGSKMNKPPRSAAPTGVGLIEDADEAADASTRLNLERRLAGARTAIQDGKAKNSEERRRKKELRAEQDSGKVPVGAKYERTDAGKLRDVWLEEIRTAFPDVPHAKGWSEAQYAMANQFLVHFDLDVAETTIRYVIRNWPSIQKKWRAAPVIPNLKILIANKEVYAAAASIWDKHREAIERYEAYGDEWAERPADVESAYNAALDGLRAQGIK